MFDGPGAFGVGFEEGFVVVGLDEECVELAEVVDEVGGDVADIGDVAEAAGVVGEDEADGVDGVVLDGEGLDGGFAEGEGLSCFEEFPVSAFDAGFADDAGGGVGGVDGDGVLFEEVFEAADVIAVFVSDEDAGEGGGVDAEELEAGGELFGGEAGIDEDAEAEAIDEGGVATAAAAEDGESHAGGWGEGGRGKS